MDLTDSDRVALRSLLRSVGYDGSVAARAQIVLWCSEGYSVTRIAEMAGTSRPTVSKWLARFERDGAEGLIDRKPTGRPPEVPGAVRGRILALSRQSPPMSTGLSHWSSRELAAYLKRVEGIDISHNFVAALWRDEGLQPWKQGTFKLSRDPAFEEKVADVVGLYLDPPDGAVVLSVDEKTQVQALDRTRPLLPLDFGKSEKRTHDYKRNGTTNLFAALDVATGKVHGQCYPRRRAEDFLTFMKTVANEYPDREIHVILDNLSTHNTPEIQAWLAEHPNITFHFTPVGSSWINQIETWFGIITRQSIRRGTFTSLRVLIKTIENYIAHWNAESKPFAWKATAGEIIAKVRWVESEFTRLLDSNDNLRK